MMRRYLFVGLISAALGAAAVVLWDDVRQGEPLNAQEPSPVAEVRKSDVPARFAKLADEHFTLEERINIDVYKKVNRSVVNITTQSVAVDSFFLLQVPAEGAGSGSVIDKKGHILTNYHVVSGANRIRVTLFDGLTYDARLVGKDAPNDMAIIKIDAPLSSLHPVEFGDSSRLQVGQKVLAIGNPFGLERTLTVGIISSLNRSLPTSEHRSIKSVIQIDAAINPGNSGGPLLDNRGRMIGMNTAIASKTGQNTGVGFAIPINTISRFVPELITKGRIVRPDLGITHIFRTERGLVIAATEDGGPAEKAGLRGFKIVRERVRRGNFIYERKSIDRSSADLIIAIDGQRVTNVDEMLTAIEKKRPGKQVVVTIVRDGKRKSVRVTLGEESE